MTTHEDIKPYTIITVRREGERNARRILVERARPFGDSGDRLDITGWRVNAKGQRMHSRGGWARTYFVNLADIVTV
jgi:hypothetical protein